MYVFNISTNGIKICSHIEELQSFNTFYHIIKSEKKYTGIQSTVQIHQKVKNAVRNDMDFKSQELLQIL